jgi:hypothetical protein
VRSMPPELRIHVDVDAVGRYEFRMCSGRSKVTTSVDPDLATSFFEDLRLLRWKSVGINDPGDILRERFANHRSVTGGRAAEGCDSSQVTDLPLVGQPIG